MEWIVTIGLDLAKNIFQVHGVAADGRVIVRRQLRRADMRPFFSKLPACLIGMEACSSAHYWGRELVAMGHTVKMMPPAYVKPYVKRGKTDAADAAAICEAVTRPTMRFVPIKTAEQQAVLTLHKVRELLVRQKVMLTNAMRAHLGEFGMVASQGPGGMTQLFEMFRTCGDALPAFAHAALNGIIAQIESAEQQIKAIEIKIMAWHRGNEQSLRLAGIPGIGPITASAIAASVPDANVFRSGRCFAAWLGLTPRAHSSGGKERALGISKQGDGYLRRLLVLGATAVLRYARQTNPSRTWATRLLERKRPKVVAVALANKNARIAWVLMSRDENYVAPAL
ncbi:IS110 family transposase [Acidiphilium sp. AL]|nr:IS110 family transposase [Acidiphilium sp. AL]MCU4160802.1 IS110 family transposase [Acidiphilium sp. AL]